MKKIILITITSIIVFSCGGKDNNTSIETLISTKNVKALQEKKSALQAEITTIE